MFFYKKIIAIVFFISLFSCGNEISEKTSTKNQFAVAAKIINNNFNDYWYEGKAEITSYDLQQARYGEIRDGSAVLVFVTEDFSKSKQVKLDYPSANRKDAVPVLKLNVTRKFNTGIYPYSMMNSSFTPIDSKKHPNTLKITSSSQEWCGHTFMQLNLNKKGYQSQLLSYFESEGDQTTQLKKTWLEDEIWSRIRINPSELPQGDIEIIPSTIYARMRHIDFKNEKAIATLVEKGNEIYYSIEYKNLDRKLTIVFEKSFPHIINGWEENYTSGFGSGAKTLTTKATRKKSIKLDYWSKNNNADAHYREELGLD